MSAPDVASYDYVRRTYGRDPQVGGRVKHVVTSKLGTILPEDPSRGHYVMVRFDGLDFPMPCHPDELVYLPASSKAQEIQSA